MTDTIKQGSSHGEPIGIRLEPINDTAAVLHFKGYVDTYNANRFQADVLKAAANGYIKLIFNCTELSYVSSAGVGAFLVILKAIRLHGGSIVLVNIADRVYEVFRLLGFAPFFPVVADMKNAIHFLSENNLCAAFPQVFVCPVCKGKTNIARPGRFRCAGCHAVLAVDGNAQIFLG